MVHICWVGHVTVTYVDVLRNDGCEVDGIKDSGKDGREVVGTKDSAKYGRVVDGTKDSAKDGHEIDEILDSAPLRSSSWREPLMVRC